MKIEEHMLTAYALGELEPAKVAEVEELIAENSEAAELVAEIRRAAAELEYELAVEPNLYLRAEQVEKIRRAASKQEKATVRRWPRIVVPVFATATAVVLFSTATFAPREFAQVADHAPEQVIVVEQGYRPQRVVEGVLPDPQASSPQFGRYAENNFASAQERPASTFSIDVDTASYSIVRRYLQQERRLPPIDAVRVEEMINYFDWDLAPPADDVPIAIHADVTDAPWNAERLLARVALKSKEIDLSGRKPMNLVFLIDVSGSMSAPDRLALVVAALERVADTLDRRDRVSLVVYAGQSGLVLGPTPGSERRRIREALRSLRAGGGTNGGSGIHIAYEMAQEAFIAGGTNRVILATDGDFNVGLTKDEDLVSLVEAKAKTGVFLSVLGVGMSNLNDAMLEQIADRGNGNYAYADTIEEAERFLVKRSASTYEVVAKDVKVQVEMNRARVAEYRLIGYENRALADHEFADDRKDAGEMGSGHEVTFLYELVPAAGAGSGDLFEVNVRYQPPEGGASKLISRGVEGRFDTMKNRRADMKFAAAIVELAMLLRASPHRGKATYASALALAREGAGGVSEEERAELISLIELAREIDHRQ